MQLSPHLGSFARCHPERSRLSGVALACPELAEGDLPLNRHRASAKLHRRTRLSRYFIVLALLVVSGYSTRAGAQTNQGAVATAPQATTTERDGQHDFDFEIGSWKIHLKRRLHPLTGSNTWVEFDGTSVTRRIWDGRSQIEEFETDGAAGHIEGLTLRLYNPETHQWSLYWANSKNGTLVVPQIGQFKDGQGEFYAQDMLDGKSIFVRFIWSKTDSNTPHFEQSFSNDGGKTWEVNWITDQTRVSDAKENVR